jgi:hypothetical protein
MQKILSGNWVKGILFLMALAIKRKIKVELHFKIK